MPEIDVANLIKLSIALIAIVDIPGNVPMFLQQTGPMTGKERRVTAFVSAIATVIILIVFANFGETILSSFGITIDAFRVLGGIVVLLIALDMLGLLGEGTVNYGAADTPTPVLVGIFPMAVPLFAGPGAITAVMIYAHEAEAHPEHHIHVSSVIVIVGIAILLGLLAASLLARLISPVAQAVLNRLLGMIVGALGVEFILEGLQGFFAVG